MMRTTIDGVAGWCVLSPALVLMGAVPLSADVRYTENDQLMPIGDGFWGTATGVGNDRQVFADPATQQVAFMGTMREGNNLLLMAVRLRVQLGRIGTSVPYHLNSPWQGGLSGK
jgi:hypothetical protein